MEQAFFKHCFKSGILYSCCPLDDSLERSGFMESGKEWSQKMVYRFIDSEYFSYFGNHLYFLFFETETKC